MMLGDMYASIATKNLQSLRSIVAGCISTTTRCVTLSKHHNQICQHHNPECVRDPATKRKRKEDKKMYSLIGNLSNKHDFVLDIFMSTWKNDIF